MAANRGSGYSASGFFANLTNGVSQQPERVRLDSQQDEVVNCWPAMFHQMAGQRPPVEIVSELHNLHLWLNTATNGQPYVHRYVRDASESYRIFLDGAGGCKVFDRATGVEKTVTISSVNDYLDNSNPEGATGFFALTYKDTTWIVNRAVTVAMESTLSATRTYEALIFVKDYVTAATYAVTLTVNGTTISITPSGGDVNAVATDIKTDIEASGSWAAISGTTTITVYSNVVHISNSTYPITLKVSDNRSGTAIKSFKDEVLKVGDLTPYAPHGYIVKVTGSSTSTGTTSQDANTADDQYYHFVANDGSGGEGKWSETVAPGIKYQLDADTMPHKLVRNGDGTFTLSTIDWGTRDVGDEVTNPNPLFVGQTITSVGLLGNRLGFLTGNGFIFSRVGEESYYEFFRSTTAAQLDDDPVFGTIPSQQVNKAYHMIAWNGELVIFGDLVDGVVNYGNKFSLSNINITTPTVSGISQLCGPLLSGSDLLLITESGEFSNISSYEIDQVTNLKSAEDITESYLGRYIPKNVKRMTGPKRNFVALLSTEERDKLYIMTYNKKAQRLVQQAIVTWDFSNIDGIEIVDIEFDGYLLYLTYKGPGGRYYIGKLDTAVGAQDAGFVRKCNIDHRMTATGVYDGASTTFTLPYQLTAGDTDKLAVIATCADNDERYTVGEALTSESDTETTLVFDGNLSDPNLSIYAGYPYSRYFVPNPIYSKTSNPDNSQRVTDLAAQTQLSRIHVGFFNTQELKVELISKLTGRTLTSREFKGGLQLDNGYAKMDSNGLSFSGILLLDGMGASTADSYLKISSDSHLPFYVDMIQWLASAYDAKS